MHLKHAAALMPDIPGKQVALQPALNYATQCPLRVKNGLHTLGLRCPLYPPKQNWLTALQLDFSLGAYESEPRKRNRQLTPLPSPAPCRSQTFPETSTS